MIAYIKRLIQGKRKDIEQSGLVYWGKVNGHRLYYWQSIDHMFAWRLSAIYLGFDRIGFGMTNEGFDTWHKTITEKFNTGDYAAVGALLSFVKEYKDQWGQYDALMHIAGCGILVNGEPVGSFSVKHNKIKEELLRENLDVRAFFLNTSVDYLKKLSPDSNDSEIRDYWSSPAGTRMATTLWSIARVQQFENLWSSVTAKSYGWLSELVLLARMIYFRKQ